MQDSDSIRNGPAMRTGPVGRLARLVLAVVAIASFVSIADQGGPSSFQGSRNLLEPSLLVLDAVMLALFVNLVGVIATIVSGRDAASRSRLVSTPSDVSWGSTSSTIGRRTIDNQPHESECG